MATIQVGQNIKLEEVIIEAFTASVGGSRSIREIKESLNRINVLNYNGSLCYSKKEFYRALEQLVRDGFRRENVCYRLYIRIYSRLLREPRVRFWLGTSEDKPLESVSMSIPQKTDSEPEEHLASV